MRDGPRTARGTTPTAARPRRPCPPCVSARARRGLRPRAARRTCRPRPPGKTLELAVGRHALLLVSVDGLIFTGSFRQAAAEVRRTAEAVLHGLNRGDGAGYWPASAG